MLCSQGLFCRQNNGRNREQCNTHCQMFPESPVCPDTNAEDTNEEEARRRLLAVAEPVVGELDGDADDATMLDGAVATADAQIVRTVSLRGQGRKTRMV